MNTPTVPFPQKRRLQAHFGFTGMPFRKNVPAHKMFDSRAQRELVHALVLWLEVKGFALVTGPTGVGKSISLRRFSAQIDEQRFRVLRFDQVPSTPMGLLRSLCRLLGSPCVGTSPICSTRRAIISAPLPPTVPTRHPARQCRGHASLTRST
ncbi:MAG: AAA family ATPase [Alphaproteobacteria bacterium]|nr:AAA family ATPase [Alphaproteobacteria bacterium]